LVREDGPADAIARTRERLGESQLGAMMDCFYCTSMWVAIPFAFYAAKKPAGRLAAWLALSGVACLIDESMKDRQEIGGSGDVLRKETSGE
jgi:hypothetical protein